MECSGTAVDCKRAPHAPPPVCLSPTPSSPSSPLGLVSKAYHKPVARLRLAKKFGRGWVAAGRGDGVRRISCGSGASFVTRDASNKTRRVKQSDANSITRCSRYPVPGWHRRLGGTESALMITRIFAVHTSGYSTIICGWYHEGLPSCPAMRFAPSQSTRFCQG